MIEQPWLTIVTVVKDDAEGFTRSLASLRDQNLSGVEYLVVDSSSDRDAVPTLAASSAIPAHVTWVDPEGIYSAMNFALTQATGEYVYFLNAGDELLPDSLSRVHDAVVTSSPLWLFGEVEVISADGSRHRTPRWDYRDEAAHHFARGHFPSHQGTFARTEAISALGGFDTSLTITADYAIALGLSQQEPPAYIDAPIAAFHEGGVSTRRWYASIAQFHRARRQVLGLSGRSALAERALTARQFTLMAAYRSPWPLALALMLVAAITMVASGVSPAEAATLTVLVALQALAGAIWWRMLRPDRAVPVLEAVGMGLGLGTIASLLVGIWLPWWLAAVAAIAAWYLVPGRARRAPLAPLARPDLSALVVGLIPGLAAMALALRNYPLTWAGHWAGYHGDMPFFEALSVFASRLGPGTSGFMTGAELKYHSLAYAWAGDLTLTVEATPFVVLTRLLPLVALIASIALAASWARSLTRNPWAPSVAVALIVTGGFVGATYGSILNFDSPSQSMGVVWLLALSLLVMQSLSAPRAWWYLLPVGAVMVALTGGKVSTAAIALAGLAMVAFIGLLRRDPWGRRALGLVLVAGAAAGLTYVVLLAGSANSGGLGLFTLLDRASSLQGLNPVITPRGIVAGIAILVIAVLPRWAGLAWLLGDRSSRWSASTTYGLGLALGAVATIVLLSGGFNDLWFAVAASAPLAVLSAVGMCTAWSWLGTAGRRRAKAAAAWGLLVCLFIAALWATGSTGILGQGWRWFGPIAGVGLALVGSIFLAWKDKARRWAATSAFLIITLVFMAMPARLVYAAAEPFARAPEGSWSSVLFGDPSEFMPTIDLDYAQGWTDTQAAAGAWLRENSEPSDVVATNVTLTALVPSLARRATYVSDIHIQAPYGNAGDLPLIAQREAESWAFVTTPSLESLAPLCTAGVRWIWVDPRRTEARSWEPWARTVWEAEDVVILRVDRALCP